MFPLAVPLALFSAAPRLLTGSLTKTLLISAKLRLHQTFRSRMSSKDLWNVVFVLGPPGCGKGTQCSKIYERFGYVHLSAGDLLRAEQNREGSEFGQLIAGHIKNGTIVPVEITCKLLENAMKEKGKQPGFLIDGFPRNQDNYDGWVKQCGDKTDLKFVLFLDCKDTICLERCLSRGEGRADDNEESFRKRIQGYINSTMPIIQFYQSKQLVRTVDAALPKDKVFEEVETHFKNAGVLPIDR